MNRQKRSSLNPTTWIHEPDRTDVRRRAVRLGLAAGAVALLAACGDKKIDTRASNSTTAASLPGPPAITSTMPEMPPAVPTTTTEPVTPPTPEETKAAWKDGVKQFESRDYESAAVSLQIAASGRPDDAGVHYLHGLALFKSGHLEESEAALVRASSLDAGSIRTWTNLARVRLARGDFKGGLDAADQALTIDSGSADALHQRGRALEEMGKPDEALQMFEQARAAAPDNGWIANSLGHLLLVRGRVDEAIPHLELAGDRLPTVGFVRNNLGVAYERRGDLTRAAEEYRAAVENGDPDGKAAASLSRIEPMVGPVVASGNGTPDQEVSNPRN
jgi:Flp pilus assembly protein TadD